jgi:hypothetical protein
MTSGILIIVTGKYQLSTGFFAMTTGILIIASGKIRIASGLFQISSCRIQNAHGISRP